MVGCAVQVCGKGQGVGGEARGSLRHEAQVGVELQKRNDGLAKKRVQESKINTRQDKMHKTAKKNAIEFQRIQNISTFTQ